MTSRQPIRVLVVDDSVVLRELLGEIIDSDPGFTVVAKARDGEDALKKVERYQPDVVTLDVQMPRMDGLETLDRLLESNPVPVIMVSALTTRDTDVTLQALDRGAMDYIAKPTDLKSAHDEFRAHLIPKLRAVAGADVQRILRIRRTKKRRLQQARTPDTAANRELSDRYANCCIAIGISTGGPPALSSVFEALVPPLPPIVVVQHMPANFTEAFARRLDSIAPIAVKEAATGDRLVPNAAYIAPGGRHLVLRRGPNHTLLRVKPGEPVSGHKPSVDVMMKSVAEHFGDRCVGVIMTGMGHDGVDGCAAICAAGGYVLGQDQATSDVYGMNRAAYVAGHVHEQFPLQKLAELLSKTCQQRFAATAGPTLAGTAPAPR